MHDLCPGGWGGRRRRQLCIYMAKVLVKIRHREGPGVGGWTSGGREESRPAGRERHEGGGCWNGVPASWISQPLGEVFRKYPFSRILFVLLPVVLLHAHQPAVVLMVTDTKTPTDVSCKCLGCSTKLSSTTF